MTLNPLYAREGERTTVPKHSLPEGPVPTRDACKHARV